MISFVCKKCDFAKQLPANYAGKKVACPKCKTPATLGETPRKPLKASEPPVIQPQVETKSSRARLVVNEPIRLIAVALASAIFTSLCWGSVMVLRSSTGNQATASNATTSGSAASPANTQQKKEKLTAIMLLKKVGSYTEVGINKRDYGSKLLDVNAELNSQLLEINDSDFCDKAKDVMAVYKDANSYWSNAIRYEGQICSLADFEANYYADCTYLLPVKYNTNSVNRFWLMASEKLEALEAKLGSE